jgi:hypothetical protein
VYPMFPVSLDCILWLLSVRWAMQAIFTMNKC